MKVPTASAPRSGGRRARHGATALLATPCLLLGGALTAMGAVAPASSPLAPPLQAQPGTPASGCQTSTDTPNTLTRLMTWTPSGPTFSAADVDNAWVDPWMPCRIYRTRGLNSVDRSSDEGRTWSTVFHEDSSEPQPSFLGSSLHVPAPGMVALSERGNGDAVVRSTDAGEHWNLADGGIEGQPIYDLVTAPSDPTVMYAVVASGSTAQLSQSGATELGAQTSTAGMFESRDGGSTWAAQTLPPIPLIPLVHCGAVCPQWIQLVVDPTDSGHAWMLLTGQELYADDTVPIPNSLILERSGEGAGWQLDTSLASEVSELVVTHTPQGGQRLYAVDHTRSELDGRLLISTDDAQSWTVATMPALYPVPFVAADPADGNRMLFAGTADFPYGVGGIQTFFTTDGFRTWQRGPTLLPPGSDQSMHIIGPGTFTPSGNAIDDRAPTSVIQADRLGRFYLWVQTAPIKTGSPVTEAFWRLTPASTSGAGAGHASTPPPSALSVPRQGQRMQTVATCRYGNGSQQPSGSLTFDGKSLLYTFYQESSTVPGAGVIHTMDPLTCAGTGIMRIDFDPADLATVARHDSFPQAAAHPWIATMTYDADDDALWFSLNVGDPSDYQHMTEPPIFSVPLDHRGGGDRAAGRARLRFFGSHCTGLINGPEELLSYDFTDHTLWTCDHGGAGHVRASDGASIPSCMAIASYYGQRDSNSGMTNWTLGAPGELYVSYENDQSVYQIDTAACTLQQRYQHAQYSEAQDEAEQIACDSLTFSVPRPQVAGIPGTMPVGSVLWIRDAGTVSGSGTGSTSLSSGAITAFLLPSGHCPFPTTLDYRGPASVTPGGAADLCTTLMLRGHGTPLASLPVRLMLDGIDLGLATTDARGVACVHTQVTLPPGRYPVGASFSGTDAYLGSTAAGSLLVAGDVVAPAHGLPPASLIRAAVFAPPPPQGPAPPAAVNPAAQAQIEAQAQAQVQSQVQTQTHVQAQPGLMVQPQRQRQVATQTAPSSLLPAAQYATRTRHAAAALVASAALLPLLAWRRRVTVVEVRRRAS